MSAKHPTDNAGFQNHQHHYDRHRHYLNEYISTKQRNNSIKKAYDNNKKEKKEKK